MNTKPEPSAQDEMRAAFEAKYAPKADFAWVDNDGRYKSHQLQQAWEIWQACAQWQATRQAVPSASVGDGWASAIEWLRNNYQNYKNIASLCESMLSASTCQQVAPSDRFHRGVRVAAELVAGASKMQSLTESAAILEGIENRRLERDARLGLVASAAPVLDDTRMENIREAVSLMRKASWEHDPDATLRWQTEIFSLIRGAAPVQTAVAVPDQLVIIKAVQQYLVDVVRSFGDISCAAYISTWHKPEQIAAALAANQPEQTK